MLNNASPNISYADESIQPLMNQIQSYDKFGVLKKGINISRVKANHSEVLKDQFTLSIPYANKNFRCDVLFDLHYPHLGPDFIFEDEAFLSDPTSEEIEKNVPSLAKWDIKNQNALLNVLKELSNYYKQHQIENSEKNGSRLRFEYDMLVPGIVRAEDVEVVSQDKNKLEACFYIYLNLDYSSLPYRNIQEFKDMATLVITYQGHDWSHIIPQLELTETLKETLQRYSTIKLPVIDGTNCLMDYVTEVKNILEEAIKSVSSLFKFKMDFVTFLKVYHNHNIIEYDSEEFKHISLLIEYKKTPFIVKFQLPDMFPQERPEMTMFSIYSLPAFQRIGHTVKQFEYNTNWSIEEMALNLFTHIVHKELDKFVKLSEKEGC